MSTSEAPELIGFAHRTLRDLRLRVAGASGGGPDALREAGYAGAESLFNAFESWVAARGAHPVKEMPINDSSTRVAEFSEPPGRRKVRYRSLHNATARMEMLEA